MVLLVSTIMIYSHGKTISAHLGVLLFSNDYKTIMSPKSYPFILFMYVVGATTHGINDPPPHIVDGMGV